MSKQRFKTKKRQTAEFLPNPDMSQILIYWKKGTLWCQFLHLLYNQYTDYLVLMSSDLPFNVRIGEMLKTQIMS